METKLRKKIEVILSLYKTIKTDEAVYHAIKKEHERLSALKSLTESERKAHETIPFTLDNLSLKILRDTNKLEKLIV